MESKDEKVLSRNDLRNSIIALENRNKVKNIVILTISVVCVVLLSVSIIEGRKIAIDSADNQIVSDNLESYKSAYNSIYDEYADMVVYTSECEDIIKSMYAVIDTAFEQNYELVTANNDYYEKILAYQEREELFDKYEYAIMREDGTRTDITYQDLIDVEEMCDTFDIDSELLLAIVMTESNGEEDASNPISTARGYGQFLDFSGEYTYEKLMGWGDYDHDYAYDGSTNLTMMCYYLNYLYGLYGNDLYSVIKAYRGEDGMTLSDYLTKIDSYLSTEGLSIDYLNSLN